MPNKLKALDSAESTTTAADSLVYFEEEEEEEEETEEETNKMFDESSLASGIFENFKKCIALRDRYMVLSLQQLADNPINRLADEDAVRQDSLVFEPEKIPHATAGVSFSLGEDGVYQIQVEDGNGKSKRDPIPTMKEYYADCDFIASVIADGPTKTLSFRRLRYLEAQFSLYQMLNEMRESDEQKMAPHRDFYNVRKVDTHVHHSACMNCKHLLRFIKAKLRKHGNDPVIYRDGTTLTLAQVFESLNITAYDLNIDMLDMHAHKDSFHRFDRFNLKYNPIGESRLREIFLKTDNRIGGRYLAEITREVFSDLQASKYQMAEYRLSIYGRSLDEWDKLAAWVVDNNLHSDNVRWLVQIPRLYDTYKNAKLMNTFEDFLKNIFQPLFEVTRNPSSHPKLHHFLKRVVGFDTVDDESKSERRIHKTLPFPRNWESPVNPPYSYYLYHLYANIAQLNRLRNHCGYSTFMFRPHSGEAGDPDHLINAFLTAYGINHGILLRKVPALQYLYYLTQVGIAMSPLSNNALFLAFDRNPFPEYFQRGLNVSLSTDDPLQFHYTKEPLIEEYSVAAQIWKLSSSDMCEIARNSVMQSGFELCIKKHWLGVNCQLRGPASNCILQSNIPNIRVQYRYDTLRQERAMVLGEISLDDDEVIQTMLRRPSDQAIAPVSQVLLKQAEEDELYDGPVVSQ